MKSFPFNLRHLKGFVRTYELGTLKSAAKSVNISQPALTQGLTLLEDKIGEKLFDRLSDGMSPTPIADLLYPRAARALGYIRSNRVTQTQLRAFGALARTGSYVEAGSSAGLARASIHRAVSDLEAALGKSLVERRGRGVSLSKTGRSLARQIRLADLELMSALDEISSLKGDTQGHISIGAMPLCRARVLPQAIVLFRKKYPDARISISEGSHLELLEPLRDGELDILIGALRTPPPGPDLSQTPLFDDHPVILARQGHPAGQQKSTSLAALRDFEWCVPPRGVPLRDGWEDIFTKDHFRAPNVKIECGSVIAIRQILMGTDYLTILSPDQVAVELEAGWLEIIGPAPRTLKRTIGVTNRNGWRPTELQNAFMKTLVEVSSEE